MSTPVEEAEQVIRRLIDAGNIACDSAPPSGQSAFINAVTVAEAFIERLNSHITSSCWR